jgi:hypothetical protein
MSLFIDLHLNPIVPACPEGFCGHPQISFIRPLITLSNRRPDLVGARPYFILERSNCIGDVSNGIHRLIEIFQARARNRAATNARRLLNPSKCQSHGRTTGIHMQIRL